MGFSISNSILKKKRHPLFERSSGARGFRLNEHISNYIHIGTLYFRCGTFGYWDFRIYMYIYIYILKFCVASLSIWIEIQVFSSNFWLKSNGPLYVIYQWFVEKRLTIREKIPSKIIFYLLCDITILLCIWMRSRRLYLYFFVIVLFLQCKIAWK